jgi:fatty acid desaturase
MSATSGVDSGTPTLGFDDKAFDDTLSQQWYQPAIPRAVLKELMKRSDAEGWRNFGLWLVLLIASGAVAAMTWGTWWAVPAFFVYGTIYSSSDARWHELAHGTPFKSRRANDFFYHLSSFMTIREGYWWRWSHARHHTHTYFQSRDPEIQVARPTKVWPIVIDFFGLMGCTLEIGKIVRHAFGRVDAATDAFLPASEKPKMIWSCRIYLDAQLPAADVRVDAALLRRLAPSVARPHATRRPRRQREGPPVEHTHRLHEPGVPLSVPQHELPP